MAYSPYEILGVSPDASPEEIKQAWRKLISAHHPDKFPSDSKQWEIAHQEAKLINEAYRFLKAAHKKVPPPTQDPNVKQQVATDPPKSPRYAEPAGKQTAKQSLRSDFKVNKSSTHVSNSPIVEDDYADMTLAWVILGVIAICWGVVAGYFGVATGLNIFVSFLLLFSPIVAIGGIRLYYWVKSWANEDL